jgi:hypothetical protein
MNEAGGLEGRDRRMHGDAEGDPPVRVLVEPVDGVLVVHVRESDAKPVHCGEDPVQEIGDQRVAANALAAEIGQGHPLGQPAGS